MNDKAMEYVEDLRKLTKASSVKDSLLNDLHLALILENKMDILRLSIILGIYRELYSLLNTNLESNNS